MLSVSHSIVGTTVTIRVPGEQDVVISGNGANLTYVVDGGTPRVVGAIGAANISLLKVNATSATGSNKIVLSLSAANFGSLLKAQVNSGGGNDTVNASASDVLVFLDGGAGDDVLIGGQAITGGTTVRVPSTPPYNRTYQLQDTLLGGIGNDVLIGGAGNDSLLGGIGNDTMSGESGNDFLRGEAGHDKLSGGNGSDTVSGGAGNDSVSGDDGDDYVYGGVGIDTVAGGLGLDVIKGQEGRDQIEGSRAAAQLEVNTLNTNQPLVVGTRYLDPNDKVFEFMPFVFDLSFVPNANQF